MLEMNARSLQQKLETERELKQRLMEEVQVKQAIHYIKEAFKSKMLGRCSQDCQADIFRNCPEFSSK